MRRILLKYSWPTCLYLFCTIECGTDECFLQLIHFTVVSTIMEETVIQAIALYNKHQLPQLDSMLQRCNCSVFKAVLPLLDTIGFCLTVQRRYAQNTQTPQNLSSSMCKTKAVVIILCLPSLLCKAIWNLLKKSNKPFLHDWLVLTQVLYMQPHSNPILLI